ncbi:hypothetical protein TeGR_g12622, partial [Tetraparma gracilis]
YTIAGGAAAVSVGSEMRIGISFTSAAAAALLSCVASQPGDMLLSVVNSHKSKGGTRDVFSKIWEEDGPRGFLTGFGARLAHVGLIVTTQLLIYDFVKAAVGLGVSGSA